MSLLVLNFNSTRSNGNVACQRTWQRFMLSRYVRVTSILYHIFYSGHSGRGPLLPFQELLHLHDKMCLLNSKHVRFINFLRSFTFINKPPSCVIYEQVPRPCTICTSIYLINNNKNTSNSFLLVQ